MKYLKTYENFSKEQIERVLSDAIKSGEIDMVKTNLDNLMNRFIVKEKPQLGTFEYFVQNEANFISEGDWSRMEEYIQKFKEMNLDVTEAEKLLPKIKRYKYLQFGPLDYHTEYDKQEVQKFEAEFEELHKYIEPFENIIKKLSKEAKNYI